MSFRVEQKYRVNKNKLSHLYEWILKNNGKKMYLNRMISSIYFDNHKLSSYHQSIEGLVPRKKIHIYPFALQPTIFSNPSGSFNISNKTGVELKIKFSSFTGSYEGELYALGRRILIIQNGSCRVQDIS